MTEYMVLGVQAYSLPNEKKPGEYVEGISIYYLDLAENYGDKLDQTDPKEAIGGFLSGKLTAKLEDLRYFSELPGIYDIETKMKRTSKGSVAKLVKAEFKSPIDLVNLSIGIEQVEKRVNNILTKVAQELPGASEGKINKEQVPNVIDRLKARIPELATHASSDGSPNLRTQAAKESIGAAKQNTVTIK